MRDDDDVSGFEIVNIMFLYCYDRIARIEMRTQHSAHTLTPNAYLRADMYIRYGSSV